MAKKKSNNKKTPIVEKTLPQNILPIGERVEENKNIYISQPVYKEIHKFTKNKTTNESGGVLIGEIIEEFGKTNIIIRGFVEAKYCEATPTTLTFTHETWDYVHKEIDKKFPKQKIVGWIHTHPNFGIFLSEYDKFIQENFFKEDYQIAYVVDPIQDIEGFYFWINGQIERCKGFYKFDKTGVKIADKTEPKEPETTKNASGFGLKDLLIVALVIAVVCLTFSNINQNKEINKIKEQQKNSITIPQMEQICGALLTEIESLNDKIENLENQHQQPVDSSQQTKPEQENDNVDTTDDEKPTGSEEENTPSEE